MLLSIKSKSVLPLILEKPECYMSSKPTHFHMCMSREEIKSRIQHRSVNFLVWFTDCTGHLKRCWQRLICPLHVHGQRVWAPNWSRLATEVCLVRNSDTWCQSSCEASSKKCKSQQLSLFCLLLLIYNLFRD